MKLKPGYKQTVVGVIPEGWEAKPFGELFAFRNGVNADKESYGQGVRFINVLEPITYSHIHGPEITGRVMLPESVVASYAVRRGDVLFNRTSETQEEVGLAATYLGSERVVFGGFVIRGRPTDGTLDPVYSGYALRAPCIRSQIIPMGQGAIRANIGQLNLSLVVAPVPPFSEQRAIATALSDVDALLGALDLLIAKKRDLKQAAMQDLLTGKKRLPGFSAEWQQVSLEAVVDRITGTWGAGEPSPDHPNPTRIIRAGDISQDGLLTGSAPRFVSDAELLKASCRLDDIVITTSGNGLGKAWWCDGRPDISASNFVRILRPLHGRSQGRYLSYVLRSEVGLRQLQEHTATSAYPNLRPSFFEEPWIPLPPIPEQAAIAVILSDIDAEIAALDARIWKSSQLKQGMMQELLTGRIRLV